MDDIESTATPEKKTKLTAIIAYLPSFWMSLGIAILLGAAWVLYQIAWHSPSSLQTYETGEICAALKRQICTEIGLTKFSLADPCGDREAKCGAGDEVSGIYVYGVTTNDSKTRLISLATSELEKTRAVKALEVWFYDNANNKHLIGTKVIGRQQP